jgi:4'-phosphopantetheinyl transferase
MMLFPVVMPLVNVGRKLCGKEKVAYLSEVSRRALAMSARKSGLTLESLAKDADGVPCPINGKYWSVSHKPRCVAAVVGRDRVGIDVEEVRPRKQPLFSYVASDEEWALAEKTWLMLFRYWTAKEAMLKAFGVGLSGLKSCRVLSVPDESHILLNYKGSTVLVEQMKYKDHIIAVTKGNCVVEWLIVEEPME